MLERGEVERVEVANRSLVRVYLRPDSEMASRVSVAPGQPHYQFQIGSVDAFENQMESTQKVCRVLAHGRRRRPCARVR